MTEAFNDYRLGMGAQGRWARTAFERSIMIKRLSFAFACLVFAVFCRGDINDIDDSIASAVEGGKYEWVFVYYMSLDNNLTIWGEEVLEGLEEGIVNSKVAVVVQADFGDMRGIRRISMRRVGGEVRRDEVILDSEDSANEVELGKYLDWVAKEWEGENYAVIFPDHGGRLDQMCSDDRPFKSRDENRRYFSSKWLRSSEVGKITANFNEQTGGKVRLLFLQQCGRGSVQNLFNFVDSAEYILSSPVRVGAPNTYYTAMVASAAENSDIGGDGLAEIIMAEDEDYLVYALVNNSEFKMLPERLKAALKGFREAPIRDAPERCPKIFVFGGETYYDFKSYLLALDVSNDNVGGKELLRFLEWYEESVVVQTRIRKVKEGFEVLFSGLSIYMPSGQKELERYSFLPFYNQIGIDSKLLIRPPGRWNVILRRGGAAVKNSVPRLIGIIVAGVIFLLGFLYYIFRKAWKVSEMFRCEVGGR